MAAPPPPAGTTRADDGRVSFMVRCELTREKVARFLGRALEDREWQFIVEHIEPPAADDFYIDALSGVMFPCPLRQYLEDLVTIVHENTGDPTFFQPESKGKGKGKGKPVLRLQGLPEYHNKGIGKGTAVNSIWNDEPDANSIWNDDQDAPMGRDEDGDPEFKGKGKGKGK